jgi:hypothetical protein
MKLHRARVTYGKSSRKKAQSSELVALASPTSPSDPPRRQETSLYMGPRERGFADRFPKHPDPQPLAEKKKMQEKRDPVDRDVTPSPPSIQSPFSFQPLTSKKESTTGRRVGYTNIYDIPSSDDERNSSPRNQYKRRRISVTGDDLRSKAPSPSRRSEKKATVSRTSMKETPRATNVRSNAPVKTDVQVVIKPKHQTKTGGLPRSLAKTPKKDLREGSHQETSRPSPIFDSPRSLSPALAQRGRNAPPGCLPLETGERSRSPPDRSAPRLDSPLLTKDSPGRQSRRSKHTQTPRTAGQKREAVEGTRQMASNVIGESPATANPNRRRLVDGLNAYGSNTNGAHFTSAITDDYNTLLPSQSDSEDSGYPSELSAARDSAPSMISVTDAKSTPASLQNSQAMGPKITYARQRSFLSEASVLADLEQEKTPDLLALPQKYDFKDRVSNTSAPAKVISTIIEDENSTTGSGAVRSIHELRQAGGNVRFQGMVDSIFDDFEDEKNPASRRRGGLIQLCHKLMDYQFTGQFLENGLDKRLSDCFSKPVDTILSSLVICAYALLLSAGPASNSTLYCCCPTMLELAPPTLEADEDIRLLAKSRRISTSRAERASLEDLCEQILKSKIWPDTPPLHLSPQMITLRCLEMAVRKVRERGERIEIISTTILDQLVKILLRKSGELQDSHTLPDDLLPLELVFSILESYTVEMSNLDLIQESSLKQLSQLGPFLSFLTREDNTRYRQLQILDTRLILNVTNNNPTLCEDFATVELISALVGIILSKFGFMSEEFLGEKREAVLDIVILALGTLINLTEWSETSRKLVLRSPDSSTTFIDSLLKLFTDGLSAVSEVCLCALWLEVFGKLTY